jgi:hypothetical protein
VRWRRGDARNLRAAPPSLDDRDGWRSPRLSLSIYTILSRRHNAVAARASVAIHTDDVASLLP